MNKQSTELLCRRVEVPMRPLVIAGPLVAFVLSGCVTATPIKQFDAATPVRVTGETRPIMFRKLVSRLPRGQEVGTVQGGLACAGQGKLTWRGGRAEFADEELADALRAELTSAGYQVVGASDGLFEDSQAWKAEFLLAGAIKHVAWNVCYPRGGFGDVTTSSGEASMEIEWQLYERGTRSVVLTATTGGTAKTLVGPQNGPSALYGAAAAALRNLLAQERFASLMSRTLAQHDGTPMTVDVLALDESADGKPAHLVEYVQGTVVTIRVGSGHGSGVVVSRSGLVLTNAHVVGERTGLVGVELATGRRVTGDVLRVDSRTDVAIIQLERGQYLAAPIGSSETVRVGDTVYAIGTPLDQRFSRTVTKGVVSAFRDDDGRRVIQSDVSVHAGNSGGPLLDERGRVIGIAQSGVAVGGHIGVGLNTFIPIEEVWRGLAARPQATRVGASELVAVQTVQTRNPSTADGKARATHERAAGGPGTTADPRAGDASATGERLAARQPGAPGAPAPSGGTTRVSIPVEVVNGVMVARVVVNDRPTRALVDPAATRSSITPDFASRAGLITEQDMIRSAQLDRSGLTGAFSPVRLESVRLGDLAFQRVTVGVDYIRRRVEGVEMVLGRDLLGSGKSTFDPGTSRLVLETTP
jgi:serine protease Do